MGLAWFVTVLKRLTTKGLVIGWRVNISSLFMNPTDGKLNMNDTIILDRKIFTDHSTIGEILVDGELLCHCLELSCRKENPDGRVAIAAGRYEITLSDKPESPLELRFNFPLPLINGVVGREGIRIHPANQPSELEGCIAPGIKYDTDIIFDSRNAFFKLIPEIQKRLALGKTYLEVFGG